MAAVTPLVLVGPSATMRALAARGEELSRDVTRPVLIVGARGLGKQHLAQRIHAASSLAGAPSLTIDARHVPAGALHALLSVDLRSTSLFVRHIQRLSLADQMVLSDRTQGQQGSARLIATSAEQLVGLVTSGVFSEELYYRVHAWPMLLPALAEREHTDLLALVRELLKQTADGDDTLPQTLDTAASDRVATHPWPDNLRELEATVALAQIRARGHPSITTAHLSIAPDELNVPPDTASLAEVERWQLLRALALHSGNRTHAARTLGISRMTLISRLKQIGLHEKTS